MEELGKKDPDDRSSTGLETISVPTIRTNAKLKQMLVRGALSRGTVGVIWKEKEKRKAEGDTR